MVSYLWSTPAPPRPPAYTAVGEWTQNHFLARILFAFSVHNICTRKNKIFSKLQACLNFHPGKLGSTIDVSSILHLKLAKSIYPEIDESL